MCCTGLVDGLDLVAQPGEIGRQDGWRDQHGHVVLPDFHF
jgi:hypothetical protein